MPKPRTLDVNHIPSINITSNLRARSKQEQLAYEHPGHFYEYVFKQKLAKFWWEVYELVLEGMREPDGLYNPLLILAPRDHAKTSNLTEGVPLWKIGRNRQELIQIICSISSTSKKRLSLIESCIRHNPRYKGLFGDLYPEGDDDFTWNALEMEVLRDQSLAWNEGTAQRDYSFTGMGMTTSTEGARATHQVYDDIVTRDKSKTPVGREYTREKFWMTFFPMLLPGGQINIVGTRYDYEDFYSELIPVFDTEKFYTDLYVHEVPDSEKFTITVP